MISGPTPATCHCRLLVPLLQTLADGRCSVTAVQGTLGDLEGWHSLDPDVGATAPPPRHVLPSTWTHWRVSWGLLLGVPWRVRGSFPPEGNSRGSRDPGAQALGAQMFVCSLGSCAQINAKANQRGNAFILLQPLMT